MTLVVLPGMGNKCCKACRYPSDDINKFLWMVRIGGGVFPDIKEPDYLGERGYSIDDKAGKVTLILIMLYCLWLHASLCFAVIY